jgi:hydrogenase maturation protein HypF
VLDAASALLGICRERTYDGEPAMKLEAAAAGMAPEPWDLTYSTLNGCEMLSTRSLLRTAFAKIPGAGEDDRRRIRSLAASFQYNLARGIAALAVRAAEREGMKTVALSGGVAYNHAIRETIRQEVTNSGLTCLVNADYPLGDGCVSFGQCVYAGAVLKGRKE